MCCTICSKRAERITCSTRSPRVKLIVLRWIPVQTAPHAIAAPEFARPKFARGLQVLESTTAGAQTTIGTPLYLAPEICNGDSYGALPLSVGGSQG